MNAPKKPGTDLSALKARLAKKAAGGDAAPAPAAADPGGPAGTGPKPAARTALPKRAPADPNFIPAPGETAPPPPAFIPAPGEAAPPQMDIPAPGEVAVPVAAAPAGRRQLQTDGDAPFSANIGGFDPNAGVIDTGGEIKERGNKGIVAMAAGGALLAGILFGYLGHQITSKGGLVQQGRDKGKVMFEEVQKVSEMRKGISLKMEDLQKTIVTNPDAGAKELVTLLTTNFEKSPKVDDLFGWQLAAVNPEGIKRTFDLYEEANGLKIDLGYLAGFVTNNIKRLAGGGPRMLAVMFKGRGTMLVERLEPMCPGADKAPPVACPEGKEGDAIGFNIRTETGGAPTFAALGTEDGQIQPLSPEGSIYGYIVGLNPENNAKIVVGSLLGRIKERLEAMSKAESKALKALKKYSDDPNVDGPAGELD